MLIEGDVGETTGRYLVLFAEDAARTGAKALREAAGLSVTAAPKSGDLDPTEG